MESKKNQESLSLAKLKDSLKAKAPTTFHEGPKPTRATMRLSKGGHDAIDRISVIRKVKNAEVFKSILDVAKILKNDKNFSITPNTQNETIRKTYVINRDTFLQLTEIAKELKISRDLLIDKRVKLLEFLLDKELQDRIDKFSKFLERINTLFDEAEKIHLELEKEVAENDPFLGEVSAMCSAMDHHICEMEDYVYKKTPLKNE